MPGPQRACMHAREIGALLAAPMLRGPPPAHAPTTPRCCHCCLHCAQATEPASLVPLVKGAECVIMAGDQKQLPPTVLSQKALE